MMSDSPTSWADRSEMPPDVCTITTDPTSEQDRALLNNVRMTDSRLAGESPVASFACVAASTPVPQPSQNATPVRGSFRPSPSRPEYLTRFERTHFHVHNVTSERPCWAVFNIQDPAIRTREIFDALLREGIPPNGVAVFSRCQMGEWILLFKR